MTETQLQLPSTDSRTDSRPRPVHGGDATSEESGRIRRWLSKEDRGQSELLGAILLFGLAIAVLVLIQVAAVPSWNQAIEFEHNQRVNEDFDRMGQVISDVAGDGGDRSVAVELGVRYPTRPFLFNPGPATGQIQTTDVRTVYINNSNVSGAGGYWQEDSMEFDTRSIQYNPSYNEYREAPETTYEYGRVIREFPNDYNTSDEAVPIVDGTNVNLIFVNGRLSEATSTTESIPIEGTSAPSNGVRLSSPDGDSIELAIPTEYPNRLADRLNNEANVNDTTVNGDTVIVELDGTKTYNLRMARIEVGPSSFENNAEYLAPKGSTSPTIPNGTDNELAVQVRDGFNNPVAGKEVTFTIESDDSTDAYWVENGRGSDTEDNVTVTSLEDGTASATLHSPDEADIVVNATMQVDGETTFQKFNVEARVAGIKATGDEGGGAEDGVSDINPGENAPVFSGIAASSDPNGDFDVCIYNPTDDTYTFDQGRISFMFTGSGSPPDDVTVLNAGGPTLAIPGKFKDLGTELENEDVGPESNPSRITLDFKPDNKDPGGSDFFVFSIRFEGPGQDTYSYIVPGPETQALPADCPTLS